MNKLNRVFVLFLMTSLGLACDSSGLKSGGSGGSATGGTIGSGGATTGGTIGSGGATSSGGSVTGGKGGSGGIGTGGSVGSGGSVTGGKGGSAAGGSVTGGVTGTGGTTICRMGPCPACLYGQTPNPEPCSCPICAPAPDAGLQTDAAKDAAPDVCIPLPCALPMCKPGEQIVTPPCGCGTCVPVDAGAPDTKVCLPIACPAIACVYGTVPNPDPCGCPICAGPDAGQADAVSTDGGKLACVGLDECSCFGSKGCSPIAEACYCPYPQCSKDGACVCGGGHFIGCAPSDLTTCAAAKSRVGSLCPTLKGTLWDNLCQQSDPCTTKCLNEVTICGNIACSMCEACGCAGDAFSACRATCTAALTK